MSYCQGQVKPPPSDYFDVYHMTEIQHFVNSYNVGPEEDITSFNLNISDEICNSPITIEKIEKSKSYLCLWSVVNFLNMYLMI